MTSKSKACNLAESRLMEAMQMIEDGMELSIQQMADVVHVQEFCALMHKHHGLAEMAETRYNMPLTSHDLESWVHGMHHKTRSGDVVNGAKWSIEETNKVAESVGIKFEHITPMEFWAVMNMVWHDYYKSAVAANMLENPEFYVSLAKDFMFDDDSDKTPSEKIRDYYYYVVK